MKARFATEADLCRAFLSCLPKEWTAYSETGGFDILLVHNKSGHQVGIEAKLTLNAKVIAQAVNGRHSIYTDQGPDYRGVLVGHIVADNLPLAKALNINVIELRRSENMRTFKLNIGSKLPSFRKYDGTSRWLDTNGWHDEAPEVRLVLPEYIPDSEPGHPSPQVLSDWKIKAIRVCIYVSKHKTISRKVFRALRIDPGRWMTGYWLKRADTRGDWVAGPYFPIDKYRASHPTVFDHIENDYQKWMADAKLEEPTT